MNLSLCVSPPTNNSFMIHRSLCSFLQVFFPFRPCCFHTISNLIRIHESLVFNPALCYFPVDTVSWDALLWGSINVQASAIKAISLPLLPLTPAVCVYLFIVWLFCASCKCLTNRSAPNVVKYEDMSCVTISLTHLLSQNLSQFGSYLPYMYWEKHFVKTCHHNILLPVFKYLL